MEASAFLFRGWVWLAVTDNLEGCKQRYDVYSDIAKTYGEISKADYISKFVEEEKQRREKAAKKNKRKL